MNDLPSQEEFERACCSDDGDEEAEDDCGCRLGRGLIDEVEPKQENIEKAREQSEPTGGGDTAERERGDEEDVNRKTKAIKDQRPRRGR